MVLPVEIHLQSVRVQFQHELSIEKYWNMILDEMTDLDEEILVVLDVLI